MRKVTEKRDEGMALVLAITFLVAMGIVVAATSTRVMGNAFQVDAQIELENTMQGIDAGYAMLYEELDRLVVAKADGVAYTAVSDGLVGMPLGHDITTMPNFGDTGVTPLTLTTMPNVEYIAFAYDWNNDGIDNSGSGFDDEGDYFAVYVFSRTMRNGTAIAQRRIETIVRGDNVNVWQNAIFAGGGQAGNVINGNVSIHGSVHILGDNLAGGGVALEAVDLSGTSLIHNNYDGLSLDLASRVPALPTELYLGEVVESLGAKLRVKNGLVGMSGNSEVGQVQVAGNIFKETMDGVYVNDGWTGTDIDANGDPQSVYSDNGWDEAYDLSSSVPFPDYSDDGGKPFLTERYLEAFRYNGTPINGGGGPSPHEVFIGDMTLTSGGDSFYWNATTMSNGDQIVGGIPGDGSMPLKTDLDPNDFYIWFDATTNTLVTNGRVAVDGNISLDSGSGALNQIFNYEGKGTLLAYDSAGSGSVGDITVNANLKTTDLGTTNLIGLMAGNDMSIGNTAQIEIMGGFYTQGEIYVDRQTTIMGTIVGSAFNMGVNVPSIFQVPAVTVGWTGNQRMIGANPVLFLSNVTWRELGAR